MGGRAVLCGGGLVMVVICAPVAAATPDDPYGDDWVAIAASPGSPGGYGTSGTADGATTIAMDECAQRSGGQPCHIASVIQYGCVAFTINNTDGTWAGGRGPDPDAASADAAAKMPPFNLGDVTGSAACSTPGRRTMNRLLALAAVCCPLACTAPAAAAPVTWPSGTYSVPDQLPYGTYTAGNVPGAYPGCIWSTTTHDGLIIDLRNATLSASAIAEIYSPAIATFKSSPGCTDWVRIA